MKHADVLATYQRLRLIRIRLNNTLVKTLSKQAIEESGRRLGLLRRGTLVFDSEMETHILMDYAIYNFLEDGRNAVQKYLEASPPPPGSEEMAVLQAMRAAYYSLFQIIDVERGVGVTVLDILRGETHFLADINFSSTAERGMVLASRVVPWEGFLMTSGTSLPVLPEVMVQIRRELERKFTPRTDLTRLTPQQESELVALVTRISLNSGMSERIAYVNPGQVESRKQRTGGLPAPVRANRNDPCPCGSGKKYKSCCGKR